MTRKSKREIERVLENLGVPEDEVRGEHAIVHEDPETGEWYPTTDMDGDPLDKDAVDPLVILRETIVETSWSP